MRITNNSADDVSFTQNYVGDSYQAEVVGPEGGAVRGTDYIRPDEIEIPAGGTVTREVLVATTTCGDTYGDKPPPLTPGRYEISLRMRYREVTVTGRATSADPSPTPDETASPTPAPLPIEDGGSWTISTSFTIT